MSWYNILLIRVQKYWEDIKKKSIRKLSYINFQGTKALDQKKEQ